VSDLEDRVTALELKLGEYIRGIEIATSIVGSLVLIEEGREDAGVYNESLKFQHRKLSGTTEERIAQLERFMEENLIMMRAFFRVLIDKGRISGERLNEMLAAPNPPRYENGARMVAKAWLNPDFKSRLIHDAKGTLRELGFALNRTPKLVVVEDTESTRNVIVCTLCSCYPYELLGNPPWWYKHDSYKEVIVKEPRKTLAEMFSLRIPDNVEIRVYDSTSDIRYMVLPRMPEGTGNMSEEELAKLVTEESLIGVGETRKPVVSKVK
jgi:nitrile hydratase